MAKRQNFIVGSANAVTESLTDAQLDTAWNRFEILGAGKLDGVFNAVSDYSNDSSNEIANAIQSITGAQPTGNSQSELAGALSQMRNEIETTSLTFKGYVATSAPSSSTYTLVEGNLWINSATMPTTFPVAASSIQRWNGTAWVAYGSTYTATDFDFWRNVNDNEGYYWFGGVWTVMSTDMSTTYFTLNQNTGKWEIKSSVNLPGSPTTTTPDSADQSTKIATTQFAHNFGQRYVTNCITVIPQNIKLELNNGTLTLKAGSKVYVPNGSGTFDTVTTTADVSVTRTDTNKCMVWRYSNGNLGIFPISLFYSGPTAPTAYTYMFWYDTTENKCKHTSDGGSTWTSGDSFPLCIVSTDGTKISAIDRIFNGFGYVGRSIFSLPAIRVLRPAGRNDDGTLKNNLGSVGTVAVRTFDTTDNFDKAIIGWWGNFSRYDYNNWTYNEIENINYVSGTIWNYAVIGTIKLTNGVISEFNIKQPFHAVDYSDFQKTAEQTNANTTNIATLGTSKANTSLNNVSAGIDFVVESQLPTAQNNYTWYRKYKSGWVEQGQYVGTSNATITFPVPMANTDYMLVGVGFVISNQGAQQIAAKTTTGFQTASDMHISGTNGYYCCGMAA